MRSPILLTILLLLAGCHEDLSTSSKSAEEARIQKEVARRVDAARLEATVRTKRLQTIRMVGFIVLAGGAVGGLLWVRQRRMPASLSQVSRTSPALWNDHYPSPTGRVIDFPAVPTPPRQSNPPSPPPPKTRP